MIYLDGNATATLRASAQEALEACVSSRAKNPSSVHALGRVAKKIVADARRDLSLLLSRGVSEQLKIIFTSGGTEAANLLLRGFLSHEHAAAPSDLHVIATNIEHAAIREPIKDFEQHGMAVSWISPHGNGIVGLDDILNALQPNTALVTIMGANNESGALQPVCEIATQLRSRGFSGAIVSDFTQMLGKVDFSALDVFSAGVDAISISAHKIGALAGVGAIILPQTPLICREFTPLIRGGAQESGLRGGTENLFGIATFGAVAKELQLQLPEEIARLARLRDLFWKIIQEENSDLVCLTPPEAVANTLLLRVPGCRGDDLVVSLDLQGVCVSTGAACSSGKQQISHVVTAMGLPPKEAREVIRVSLDWSTTEADVRQAADIFNRVVSVMLRELYGEDNSPQMAEGVP